MPYDSPPQIDALSPEALRAAIQAVDADIVVVPNGTEATGLESVAELANHPAAVLEAAQIPTEITIASWRSHARLSTQASQFAKSARPIPHGMGKAPGVPFPLGRPSRGPRPLKSQKEPTPYRFLGDRPSRAGRLRDRIHIPARQCNAALILGRPSQHDL